MSLVNLYCRIRMYVSAWRKAVEEGSNRVKSKSMCIPPIAGWKEGTIPNPSYLKAQLTLQWASTMQPYISRPIVTKWAVNQYRYSGQKLIIPTKFWDWSKHNLNSRSLETDLKYGVLPKPSLILLTLHSENSLGTHASLLSKENRLLASDLCACLCVLCPKYLWRKTQPNPKPVDIDASEFRDVQPKQRPACCIQLCKLLPLGKCLGRGSAALHGFAAETHCFLERKISVKVLRLQWKSWRCQPLPASAPSPPCCPPHAASGTRNCLNCCKNPLQHCSKLPSNFNVKRMGNTLCSEQNRLKKYVETG